jgi:hypothetical protein
MNYENQLRSLSFGRETKTNKHLTARNLSVAFFTPRGSGWQSGMTAIRFQCFSLKSIFTVRILGNPFGLIPSSKG